MSVETWDWSLRLFDHVEVHASDYDGSNVEALYPDVGNIGHGESPTLR